jgi:hypothetical protein
MKQKYPPLIPDQEIKSLVSFAIWVKAHYPETYIQYIKAKR